jgi:hypothetical protein
VAIIASDNFTGVTDNTAITGRTLTNGPAGSGTYTWATYPSGIALRGNATGGVISTNASATSLVNIAGCKMLTLTFDPNGATSNMAIRGMSTSNGSALIYGLVDTSGTVMRLLNQSTTLSVISVVQPTTPYKLRLDLRDPSAVKLQMLSLAEAVLYEIVVNVGALPSGTYWGAGSFQGGSSGVWDDFVFEDGPTVPAPVLSGASGTATGPTTASGSVTTDVGSGTLYALAALTLPSEATILASGTQFAVTATGVRNVTLTGLTHSTSGYEIYYLHKRASGENSTIVASSSFATPVPLAAPGGSAVTTVDGDAVTITYTPTGTVASATASLPAHATPNGAVTQAPKAMTLGGGVWTAVFTAVPPGDYAAPVVLASNADNPSTSITGAEAFYIDDLSGEPEAPASDPPTDTTAPTLSAASATASSSTASTGAVTTNEAGGTLYWLTNTSASATATEVKAGSSQIVSAAGAQSTASSGLTASTTGYRTHYLHRDPAGNDSTVLTTAAFNTPAPADTTAPTLSSATGAASSPTAASGTVSTNEANGTLYWLANTSASATATAVKAGSSQAVSATGAQAVTASGLTANTSGYRIHYLHRDAAGNDSAVLTSAAFATPVVPDTTAPTLSSATAAAATSTTSTGSVTTNEAGGTLYWLTNTSSTATATAVKAGSSQAVSATGAQATASTGLTVSTTGYRTHFLHRDAAGNDSAVSTSAAFNTPAAPDTTAPTLSAASASASGPTAASGSVSTDEAGGTLYWLTNTSATQTAGQVVGGSSQAVAASGAQAVTVSGLTASTTGYRVHFCHVDAAGNQSAVLTTSAFNTPALPDTTIPVMAGSIAVSAKTHNAYTLTWSAATDNAAVTGYERSLDGGTSWTDAGNVLTVNITGRTPSATDQVRVRAYDAAGNKATALSAAVTLDAAPDTTAPVMTGTVSLSNLAHNSYTTGCDAATDAVGVTGYAVSQDGGTSWIDKATARTHDHTGRTPSTTDQVQWRARDAAGNWATPITRAVTLNAAPPLAGFDFDTAPGMVFGDLAGALAGLTRQSGVAMTARAYNATTGALVASSSTLTTSSTGRLARWEHASIVSATPYAVVFTRASDGEVCATLLTAT